MDDADRLNCDDVVCARGGHYACHDLPPPREPLVSDETVRLTLSRYSRGASRIAGFNTPRVGYLVRCSCGFETRNNSPRHETLRAVVRPHLRDAHGLRGESAEGVIR